MTKPLEQEDRKTMEEAKLETCGRKKNSLSY